MEGPPKIRKLDEAVINRIAAGEIIQRPHNAIKELIENSIDAQSTSIQLTVKNGGLKLLQIQDNGVGIRKEDFAIVCDRFTTSKLQEFEDLNKISTYGFRGEALASISHIAHLSITSKTKNEVCAYHAQYCDGKMLAPPKPLAGNQGTIITVEDLFYNMNVRQTVLKGANEEHQRIADVVSKYAVHNSKIGFALKKCGASNELRTTSNSTQIDNIGMIYGSNISKELVEINEHNEELEFKVNGYVTNPNYSTKKTIFLLFINNRLVDCQSLRKSIDLVYNAYLPKNSYPFVYLSLELNPMTLDVNVHPTKYLVQFLNEEQIVNSISSAIETKLLSSTNSRVFFTQAKLPVITFETPPTKQKDESTVKYPQEVVRTDAKIQKIEKFFDHVPSKKDVAQEDCNMTVEDNPVIIIRDSNLIEETRNSNSDVNDSTFLHITSFPQENQVNEIDKIKNNNMSITEEEFIENHANFLEENRNFEAAINESTIVPIVNSPEKNMEIKKPIYASRTECTLTSILELRSEVEANCHRILRETFHNHVYVGSVSPTQALIQNNTKLLLCNTNKILQELFYQFILYNFENFDTVDFKEDLSVNELMLLALRNPESGLNVEENDLNVLSKRLTETLESNSEMLQEYFSVSIKHGNLCAIPNLLENYTPDFTGLPGYLYRLATEVNWMSEKECFHDFAKETAKFYSNLSIDNSVNEKDWKWVTEYVIYPAIKEYFMPHKDFLQNAAVLEIASLSNLYKVFERC